MKEESKDQQRRGRAESMKYQAPVKARSARVPTELAKDCGAPTPRSMPPSPRKSGAGQKKMQGDGNETVLSHKAEREEENDGGWIRGRIRQFQSSASGNADEYV